jgi:sec-independent protein translocase protein TatC
MTFIDHLEELRSRIIKALFSLFIGFVICYFFADEIMKFLLRPLDSSHPAQLTLLSPTEGFMVKLKVALIAGVVISSPAIFYQIWRFVAPALYDKERRMVFPVVFWSAFLFILGAIFAYLFLPYCMRFFQSFATEWVVNFWSLKGYITFITYIIFAFGLVFELPLVLYFAARLGLVTSKFLRQKRRHAIIVLLILAAIVTPPDVVSQLVISVPLIILYEVSIFLARIAEKRRMKSSVSA